MKDFAQRAAEVVSEDPFLERVRSLGRGLALAQLLLKLTSPGMPDNYRGDELEDLSLVDPDNRRPVDWAVRRRALETLEQGGAVTADNAKLYVMWKTLNLRQEHHDAFEGGYDPVDAGEGVCAFVRGGSVFCATAVRPGAKIAVPDGFRDVLGVEGLAHGVR